MFGFPVLVAGAIEEQLDQLVVSDTALALGGPDAGILHRPAEGAGDRDVHDGPAMAAGGELGVGPGTRRGERCGSPGERGCDTGALRAALGGRSVAQVDAVTRGRL